MTKELLAKLFFTVVFLVVGGLGGVVAHQGWAGLMEPNRTGSASESMMYGAVTVLFSVGVLMILAAGSALYCIWAEV